MSREIALIGGCGDAIAFLCHEEPYHSLTKIHWCLRDTSLGKIFTKHPTFKGIEQVIHDVKSPPGRPVVSKAHLALWGTHLDADVEDWGLLHRQGRPLTYLGSPFEGVRVATQAKVARFKLPEVYTVIHATTPVNTQAHRNLRDYKPQDWDATIAYLNAWDEVGVVLNSVAEPIPSSPRLINLQGQTTLGEAIEIVKGCSAYCGIDSWMSILASKTLEADSLTIMSRNPGFLQNAPFYLAPHTTFPFVSQRIGV
jgi:hypothetical protein